MDALKTWTVAGSVLLVISATSPALGQQHYDYACSGLEKNMLWEEHEELYKYSLVAGVPSQQSKDCCTAMREGTPWDLSDFEQITPGLVRDLDIGTPLYMGQDGSLYIACSGGSDSQPSLLVLINLWWKNLGTREEPSLAVVADVLLEYATSIFSDELEFVVLRRHPETSGGPEELVAIRGTSPLVPAQWMASVKDILSSSCAFGHMVKIVDRLSRNFGLSDNDPLVVVGHSLGGTAAQHIAQQAQFENMVTLRAYVYGALGRRQNRVPSGRKVVSYHIHKDPIADLLRARLGNQQIGRSVEYVPDSSWTKGRHLLVDIQEALCRCMTGSGSLSIQP